MKQDNRRMDDLEGGSILLDDSAIERLSLRVGETLRNRRLLLVSAESCTGGWLAKAVTDIAGSSQWFDRGFVTYSNRAKIDQLGVSATVLEHEGAVSEAVVREMAQGALGKSQAHLAVAISGIAGPDGGSAEKPVGTVWMAWATTNFSIVATKLYHFTGNREAVRRAAVIAALEGIMAMSETKI